jgi:hypothetical protein
MKFDARLQREKRSVEVQRGQVLFHREKMRGRVVFRPPWWEKPPAEGKKKRAKLEGQHPPSGASVQNVGHQQQERNVS